MKQSVFFLTIILYFIFSGCENSKPSDIENDPLMKKYFNKNEIKDMKKILLFFENEVKQGCEHTTQTCLKTYLKNAKTMYLNNDLNISKEKETLLLNNISESLFNSIWGKGNLTDKNTEIIMIKPESRYMDFLKEIGNTKPAIKKYYDAATAIPVVLNAATVDFIFFHYNNFDLTDAKQRLILAIHFLTLNDQDFR